MTSADIRSAILSGKISFQDFDGITQAMQHVRNVRSMNIRPGDAIVFNRNARAYLIGNKGTVLKVNRKTFKILSDNEIVNVSKRMIDKIEKTG